jgi:hypothetical protein
VALTRIVADTGHKLSYCGLVSAKEIIQELPKLTDADRRAIREKLIELAAQNEDIEVCNQAALQGALMLDRLENEDAQRAPR